MRRDDERGVAAVIVTVFVAALLFGLCAISVDVARMYAEAQQVQKAADVAASAGVIYMPQDIDSARSTANDVSARNGYPNSGKSSVVVKPGIQPSQLDVAVSSTIPNLFGRFIGRKEATITRHAVADYTGPQPMGSPCNTFGNEPEGTAGAPPIASQLSVPAGAECSSTPQFWMNVNGPNVTKGNGDQYTVRNCNVTKGVSGCTGSTNDEFDPEGYFYLVRVQQTAVGYPITLQVYDPAFVATGDHCAAAPDKYADITDSWNDYASSDAKARYKTSDGVYCSGDNMADSAFGATTTTFGLRDVSDAQNPRTAEPVDGCTRQYPGYTSGQVTATTLRKKLANGSNNASYNKSLAQVFHQWATLCTFTPTRAGDYYLQVRTNVPWKGPDLSKGMSSYNALTDGAYQPTGSLADFVQYTQTGDNTSVTGGGSNRFSVRAYGGPAASVSVSALGKMSIYANAAAASQTFNLIRLMPAAAGQTLVFKFFDIGDADANAVLTILPPKETSLSLSNCAASGYQTGTLPTCSITINAWDGKGETVAVPIPSNYTCTFTSTGGCWFRLKVSFASGNVQDTTTWTAYVSGDPVRLIE
jgi:hypothetical protein